MPTSVLERREPWHFDETVRLPTDGHRYEVVDGALVITAVPSQRHQFLSTRLRDQVARQAPAGWEVVSELGLPLGTDGRVPDFSAVRPGAPVEAPGVHPVGPQWFGLVVEVVSPDSRKRDRFAKPGEYAEVGIPFFWRLETEPALVLHAFVLQEGEYVPHPPVTSADHIPGPWGSIQVDISRLVTPC